MGLYRIYNRRPWEMDQMDPPRVTGMPVNLGRTNGCHQVKMGQTCHWGLDLDLRLQNAKPLQANLPFDSSHATPNNIKLEIVQQDSRAPQDTAAKLPLEYRYVGLIPLR